MNCVYDACCEHMKHLGIEVDRADRMKYNFMKTLTHGTRPQQTWGGVVPWMIGILSGGHGCRVNVQHSIWTPDHYRVDASNAVQRLIVNSADFGEEVDKITLQPAIYLMLRQHHAVFSLEVPKALCVMALQIEKGVERT